MFYTSVMDASLKQIEAMVDALGPQDRARLLQYLIPRIGEREVKHGSGEQAWEEFRRVGSRLAATSNGESITQAITDSRR